MFQLDKLLGGRTSVTFDQSHRLRELVADWQLLSDLSFADLILWVPIRRDIKLWPTGHIAVAHIRPTTSSTVFINDVIGDEVLWGARPNIDEALSTGDAAFKEKSAQRINELCSQAKTLVIVSHGLGTIEELCTDAVWMHLGQVAKTGKPHEIIEAYTEFLHVGIAPTSMEDF